MTLNERVSFSTAELLIRRTINEPGPEPSMSYAIFGPKEASRDVWLHVAAPENLLRVERDTLATKADIVQAVEMKSLRESAWFRSDSRSARRRRRRTLSPGKLLLVVVAD